MRQIDFAKYNADIMFTPYSKILDGFDSHMALNCLGHFLLTSLLMDPIYGSADSRITWLCSKAHKTGRIDIGEINFDSNYSKIAAYGQS